MRKVPFWWGDMSRQGHRLPVTPEQRAEFEGWKREYEKLRDRGYETGWLYGGYDGDEVTEPTGDWVWDESEDEFKAREAEWRASHAPDGFITFPSAI